MVEHLHLVNPKRSAAPCVTTYATSGRTTRRVVLDSSSVAGRSYDVTWTIAAPGAEAPTSDHSITPAFAPGSDTSEVALGVKFAKSCTAPSLQVYERRFEVRRTTPAGTALDVGEPGRGWSRVSFTGHRPFWVPMHVDDIISLLPAT